MTEERLMEQIEEIQKINQELNDFTILTGIEVDIKSDGSLDFSDEILSKLDVVIAAIHSGFKQEGKVITERIIKRGWLEEKDIINTLPLDKLLKRLKRKL
ncbi:hypothetical protein KJ987_09640 [bacterium]|nr:hypothetical protein [bacterium]